MTTASQSGKVRALLARMQQYALFVCVLTLPIQGQALLPGTDLTLTKVAGGLLVLAVILDRAMQLRFPLPAIGIESATILALAAAAASIPNSVARDESIRALYIFVQYAAICYASAYVCSQRDGLVAYLPPLLVASSAASGIGATLARLGAGVTPTVNTIIPGSNIPRITFGLPDANEQAMILAIALAFAMFAPQLWTTRARATLALLALCAIGAGLLLTMSRTGWICAVLLCMLRIALHPKRIQLASATILAVVIAGLALMLLRPGITESVQRRIMETTGQGDKSIASRVAYTVEVAEAARKGGATGHGFGTAFTVAQQFSDPLGNRIGTTVHNVPLMVWLETGWLGAAAFLWLWASVLGVLVFALRSAETPGLRAQLAPYLIIALVYGVFSLVMPFLQRSCLPILLGCALGLALAALPRVKAQS